MPSSAPATIVNFVTLDDFEQASALYRRVFGYRDDSAALNPRLLSSLARFGGSVLGARDDDGRVIAFAYGFTGLEGAKPFHYSQAAVVAPEHQGRALGRALKLAQRTVALGHGLTSMRWTYDPWLARNAHFNLDVLGAVATVSVEDFYGTADEAGQGSTHRVVVRWDLTREPGAKVPVALPELRVDPTAWGTAQPVRGDEWIVVPSEPRDAEQLEPLESALGRMRLERTLSASFGQGHQAVSCQRVDASTSAYLLVREERISHE